MVCLALRNVCDSVWVYVTDLLYQCYDGHNALLFESFSYFHLHQLLVFCNDKLVTNVFVLLPAVWICLAPLELWANSSLIKARSSVLQRLMGV